MRTSEIRAWAAQSLEKPPEAAAWAVIRHLRAGRTVRPSYKKPTPLNSETMQALLDHAAGVDRDGDMIRICYLDGSGRQIRGGTSATVRSGYRTEAEAPIPEPPGRGQVIDGDPFQGPQVDMFEPPQRTPGATPTAKGVPAGVDGTVAMLSALVQQMGVTVERIAGVAGNAGNRAFSEHVKATTQMHDHQIDMDRRMMTVIERQGDALASLAGKANAPVSPDVDLWKMVIQAEKRAAAAVQDATVLASAEPDESPLAALGEAATLLDRLVALRSGAATPPQQVWEGVLGRLADGNGVQELAAAAARLTPDQRAALAARLGGVLSGQDPS